MFPFVINTPFYNARYTLFIRIRNSHRPESLRIARWGGPPVSGRRRHHAARDEKYLIEMFSFIYYSVSERCHLVQRREEERTRGRGEIGLDVFESDWIYAREREGECNVLPRSRCIHRETLELNNRSTDCRFKSTRNSAFWNFSSDNIRRKRYHFYIIYT